MRYWQNGVRNWQKPSEKQQIFPDELTVVTVVTLVTVVTVVTVETVVTVVTVSIVTTEASEKLPENE